MTTEALFGNPALDAPLVPLPRGARVLLRNDPGIDPVPFLLQAAATAVGSGLAVRYLLGNRPPGRLARAAAAAGIPDLVILDAYSGLFGLRSSTAHTVARPEDPHALANALAVAVDPKRPTLLVIEALPALLASLGPQGWKGLVAALAPFHAVIASHTSIEEGVSEEAFGAVISLRAMEDRALFSQYFHVERVAWRPQASRPRTPYHSRPPAGVQPYIPKILVTGPHQAGKTTFVRAISDRMSTTDRSGTTVALDRGAVILDGLELEIFGTAGQPRFDPLLRSTAAQAAGIILVVDASDPATFGRAREMLQIVRRGGVPVVVAANKQDHPGALPPDEVMARLLPRQPGAVVMPCRSDDAVSARAILQETVTRILRPVEVST